MDVGNPSNFYRLLDLYGDESKLKEMVKGFFFDDATTREAMATVKAAAGYLMDPHGAVAYLGLKAYMEEHPGYTGVFLETAHPGKFGDVVEAVHQEKVTLPERLSAFLDGQKKTKLMANDYQEFKTYLRSKK